MQDIVCGFISARVDSPGAGGGLWAGGLLCVHRVHRVVLRVVLATHDVNALFDRTENGVLVRGGVVLPEWVGYERAGGRLLGVHVVLGGDEERDLQRRRRRRRFGNGAGAGRPRAQGGGQLALGGVGHERVRAPGGVLPE